MSEKLFKKLVAYFGIGIAACLIPLIISIVYKMEPLIVMSSLLLGIAILSEIMIFSVFYSDNRKFRIVIYILIPVFFALLIIALIIPIPADILAIISVFALLLSSSIAIYIFNARRTTIFLYIFLGVIFVGILFKRFHWPGSGMILTTSAVLFSVGIFMYGLTSLFSIKKNKFLSVLIPVCSIILSIDGMSAVFKLQHWPGGGIMIQFSIISIILVTIITLLTLPQSGYFNWLPELKKSFYRNIVVPWIIAAAFIAYFFLMPQSKKDIIFPPRHETGAHFNMYPYELEQPDTTVIN